MIAARLLLILGGLSVVGAVNALIRPNHDRSWHLRPWWLFAMLTAELVPVRFVVRLAAVAMLTAFGALWSMLVPPGASAQQPTLQAPPAQGSELEELPRPTVHVERVSGIRVDGRLDEPAWAALTPLTRFIQAQPHDGEPASEDTEVYLGFDDDALYVGAHMFDSDPSALITKSLERDGVPLKPVRWKPTGWRPSKTPHAPPADHVPVCSPPIR